MIIKYTNSIFRTYINNYEKKFVLKYKEINLNFLAHILNN